MANPLIAVLNTCPENHRISFLTSWLSSAEQHQYYIAMLCDPVSYTGKPPVLAAIALEQGNLNLLPVAAAEDILATLELLKREAIQNWDVQPLLAAFGESLSSIARSWTSQAFLLKLDDRPLFEIEINKASLHIDLHPDFIVGENDFSITLLTGEISPEDWPFYIRGLQLCLDYFFEFHEVWQIIAAVYTGPLEQQQEALFIAAGLKLILEKTRLRDPDLYILTRPGQ